MVKKQVIIRFYQVKAQYTMLIRMLGELGYSSRENKMEQFYDSWRIRGASKLNKYPRNRTGLPFNVSGYKLAPTFSYMDVT